eukprot:6455287-Amphidinium_carterae.1
MWTTDASDTRLRKGYWWRVDTVASLARGRGARCQLCGSTAVASAGCSVVRILDGQVLPLWSASTWAWLRRRASLRERHSSGGFWCATEAGHWSQHLWQRNGRAQGSLRTCSSLLFALSHDTHWGRAGMQWSFPWMAHVKQYYTSFRFHRTLNVQEYVSTFQAAASSQRLTIHKLGPGRRCCYSLGSIAAAPCQDKAKNFKELASELLLAAVEVHYQ